MADKIEVDNISIYGVLNKNHTTLLDYYLEQYNTKSLEKTTPVHILTESSYPFGNNEPLKNLIISNGSLVNKITFSDNTLIFH